MQQILEMLNKPSLVVSQHLENKVILTFAAMLLWLIIAMPKNIAKEETQIF